MSEPTKCVCGHEAWEHEDRLCMGDNLACGCDGFAATPLPAPDHGAARDSIKRLAYWANLWAEQGSDETLTRYIVDGDERDALAALAPHGEAVACVGWIALDAGGERMADELFVSQAVALREWPTANAVPVFRTHPAPAARVTEAAIAGALFDFAGYLTTLAESYTVGEKHDASRMVEELRIWARTRKLSLEPADVMHWTAALSEATNG
jgi:hypothetical protein